MISSEFFELVQKACLPGIWSKGVAISRTDSIALDSNKSDEIILRVKAADHPISRRVTLWPEDEDWYCDCDARTDVCAHVAAALIALKSGKVSTQLKDNGKSSTPGIEYHFVSKDGLLHFERWIRTGEKKELLTVSLVSWMGGISSGRIQTAPISATQQDYAIDYILGQPKRGDVPRETLSRLIHALAECTPVFLDQKPIRTAPKPFQIEILLKDEGSGYRLCQFESESVQEAFKNGAVLCGDILKSFGEVHLSSFERDLLSGKGKYFGETEVETLVCQILPSLQSKVPVQIQSQKLPKVKQVMPRIVLQLDDLGGALSVVPVLNYEQLGLNSKTREFVVLDSAAEKTVTRKLQQELQLAPGQKVQFDGENALHFSLRLKNWETRGSGVKAFELKETLEAKVEVIGNSFEVAFRTGSDGSQADPKLVLQAWRENRSYVPLLNGGWAPLPKDWLNRYAERIASFVAAKENSKELPRYLLPAVGELCEELGQSFPESIQKLTHLLSHVDEIPEASLPSDLTASLRHYQQKGVSWLVFLKNANMGAMLADDMGLGKTLQALCAIQGRTLIVTPTSVLPAWAEQIKKFRPGLKYSSYYGAQRKIDLDSQVTLTTYGILRLDQKVLSEEKWDTVVLDEAQVIKNPESQVTRAAHLLKADFRVTLSGTPVENNLNDLWSQFKFLNPGLLGSLDEFKEEFSDPIANGNQEIAERLRRRIKPFILRRLKNEVAPELPPRTETVLYCELSSEERDVYDSLLASTRKEVLEKLQMGGSVFAALELLLRLRQACCHSALIPGVAEGSNQKIERSSKIDLLLQVLENSIAMGHRSLIFSQWTSYLDLIERALKLKGITYLRLDGSTRNRDEVVAEFQNKKNASVMLISLKAGGVGLTLTAADHIFLMDPWWNPSVENQAADRAHRIGQENPVLIHRIVAQNSVEERILALQQKKLELAASVLQDSASAVSITRDDLLELLR